MIPPAGSEIGADRQPIAAAWDGSRRLWSLLEMLRVYAHSYISLGARIYDARAKIVKLDTLKGSLKLDDRMESQNILEEVQLELIGMLTHCDALDLPVSKSLIESRRANPPQTPGKMDILVEAVFAELRTKLFLFVPSHRATFYENDDIVSDSVKEKFPGAYVELRASGNAFAAGLYTASVFHSMRAAEIGLRVTAKSLEVKFPFPIELAEWQNLIEKIESEVKKISNMPKGEEKDNKIKFYSKIALHFRYFKDAWRIRVSHAREVYDEAQAGSVLNHVREFFEAIAPQMSEITDALS